MNGGAPSLLDWLLGASRTSGGEGVQRALRGSWPLPPWLTILLACGVVALVSWCYLRERGGAGRAMRALLGALRLVALACVAFMLAQFVVSQSRTGLPYVVVMIDDSTSMGIEDRYDDDKLRELIQQHLDRAKLAPATRLHQAQALLLENDGQLLRAIDGRYKLKVYFVSDAARPQTGDVEQALDAIRHLEPRGEATRLGLGVRSALNDLRGTPPSALVLFSDGINTDGEPLAEAAAYARRKGVPLFTVALGSQTPVRDLELSDLLVDEVVFVDDVVSFECKLTATGLAGKPVQIVLREKNDPAPLAVTDVTAGADGKPQKVRIAYRPTKVGQYEYIIEARTLRDEASADNNTQQRLVTVRKEQVRALLVQSYPNFEFRYLKHMLQRDSTIAVRTVLQEADVQYADIDQTALTVFPVRREELFEYDVVIFGDVDPAFFTSSNAENLAAFVTQKGGGVVILAGPRFTPLAYRDSPLASLIPVDFSEQAGAEGGLTFAEGYQMQPTELGLSMPTLQLGDTLEESAEIWRRLPPLYWLFEATALKPTARVFATARVEGRELPVIALQYVGSGKVMFHATDETWRWRWRVGDVYFARYWVQTLRYLARSKLIGKERTAELSVDRREYRRGESVRMRVRFVDDRSAPAEDDGVVIMVEQEGHPNRRVSLKRDATHRGIFEGVFSKPADGKYHAWVTVPSLEGSAAATDFRVIAPPGEFEHVQTNMAELKRADETKGKFYTVAEVHRLLDDLPPGHEVPIELLPPRVLWNHWLVLALFLTTLTSEWIFRKLRGML